jgi:hypothetical protein
MSLIISLAFIVFHWFGFFSQATAISPFSAHPTWISGVVLSAAEPGQARNAVFNSKRIFAQAFEPIDDEYVIDQNEVLAVEPPGVLENDILEDEVSAFLLDPLTHLEVTFNPDGSFTYTPEEDFIGVYTFKYHLELDGEVSEPALVQITVLDTEPPKVEWVSPVSEGEILFVGFETILLEALATDNDSVAGVQFYRWDAILESYLDIAYVETAPYQYLLETKTLNPGWNELRARAIDKAGNISTSRPRILIYLTPRLFFPVLFR